MSACTEMTRALEFIRLIRIIIVQAPPSLGDETTGGGGGCGGKVGRRQGGGGASEGVGTESVFLVLSREI